MGVPRIGRRETVPCFPPSFALLFCLTKYFFLKVLRALQPQWSVQQHFVIREVGNPSLFPPTPPTSLFFPGL